MTFLLDLVATLVDALYRVLCRLVPAVQAWEDDYQHELQQDAPWHWVWLRKKGERCE